MELAMVELAMMEVAMVEVSMGMSRISSLLARCSPILRNHIAACSRCHLPRQLVRQGSGKGHADAAGGSAAAGGGAARDAARGGGRLRRRLRRLRRRFPTFLEGDHCRKIALKFRYS